MNIEFPFCQRNNFELTEIRVNLSRIIKYEIPNPYLGFQCVAEFK